MYCIIRYRCDERLRPFVSQTFQCEKRSGVFAKAKLLTRGGKIRLNQYHDSGNWWATTNNYVRKTSVFDQKKKCERPLETFPLFPGVAGDKHGTDD